MGFKGFFVILIVVSFLLDLFKELLNLKSASVIVPKSFKQFYSPKKYKKSQLYLFETTRFLLVEELISSLLLIFFVLVGGFDWLNKVAMTVSSDMLLQGIIFAGLLLLISLITSIPWDLYKTFVIEEKYNFNRTKFSTFFMDIIKSLFLTMAIGGPIWALILYLFDKYTLNSWPIIWLVIVLIQILLSFIAPAFIMPIFNKFKPLEDKKLQTKISKYLKSVKFAVEGVYVMDGSKRSAKTNAFFVGFGRFKRIALFDTLIEKHTQEEIVAILAHEVGHYKKGHIIKLTATSLLTTGLLLFSASQLIEQGFIYEMFNSSYKNLYSGLTFVGLLWGFVDYFFALPINYLSRKFEYEADSFSIQTYPKKQAFANALKKLTCDNLTNLTPHPLKVAFDYSHPPVVNRIINIETSRLK